ncbi:peptidoglycan recognition protein 1-like isoform X2 [Varroa jacobsoni]|uniref:Peptidoglycan-recognition protein n=1 Tax=Varroa destructor TaxID=109461 RepID=A0A7M7K472_VARDE|nr:peptidoglycan recognition protein 1-like isoform X2 [Varroa destructor]XP_022699797.1 peptidoglycan recognition protein 1-like isoform X2 [Varroa jacobsoni]
MKMRALSALMFASLATQGLGNRLQDENLCPQIKRRQEWGARPPKSKIFVRTVGNVIIHHSQGPSCVTEHTCKSIVRTTQLQHVQTKGWDDIGYNFLVSENGQVFEGRGWGVEAAAAMGLSTRALHVALIGTFNHRAPAEGALKTVAKLIECGVELGKVHPDYKISGHRDVEPTACPGQKLYDQVRNWTRYVKRP